jgi:hypothetical protein
MNDDDYTPTHPWWQHVIALLLWPLQLMLFGQAFSRCWAWFAVEPLGAPPIGIADACGLGTLFALLTFTFAQSPAFHRAAPIVKSLTLCVMYVVLFGVGWMFHQFQ